MATTRNTVAKGGGALFIKRSGDDRILYLATNSKYTLNKTTTEGDKVQGFNSAADLVDLDVAGSEISFELEIATKKNTRNVNEMVLNSQYVTKASYDLPWGEVATVAGGEVTLKGGTPVASSLYCTYMDGTKLASTGSAPSAGQFKDDGDGTVTFNAGDNGKQVVFRYKTTVSNVFSQGGADHTEIGTVDIMFHQVSGTSNVSGKKMIDVLWLPKCTLSGEAALEFSNEVPDKTFKATALIPDSPSGWLVPYQFVRDVELDNTNAG